MKLVDQLLQDQSSGVQVDASGRAFFRQRKVEFQTIQVDAVALHQSGWLGFEQDLPAPDWSTVPSHREVRDFAAESSRRFIEFWYRVIDVAVARALAGGDREIFRKPFMIPAVFLDIGIPREGSESSAPPALHEKIVREYLASRDRDLDYRVFYLSNYLDGITDDMREQLSAYNDLWDLKKKRRLGAQRLSDIRARLSAGREATHGVMHEYLDRMVEELIARAVRDRGERRMAREVVRGLVFRRRAGDASPLRPMEKRAIFQGDDLPLPRYARLIHGTLGLVERLYNTARSAAGISGMIHRLELRLARLRYMHRRYGVEAHAENLHHRLRDLHRRYGDRIRELGPGSPLMAGAGAMLASLHLLRRELERETGLSPLERPGIRRILEQWGETPADTVGEDPARRAALEQAAKDLEELKSFPFILLEAKQVEDEIVALYRASDETAGERERKRESIRENDSAPPDDFETRYPGMAALELPEDCRIGDPYQEHIVLKQARALITRRLRPIRRTATMYSVVPAHRHGAMTLNPIMKLWKDRPNYGKDMPPLAGLELNTRETVACLIRLAGLADARLSKRELVRGRIARMKRGLENLSTLNFFLLPGSCFPIREVHRLDFPEFRGRVIGESRAPRELGIAPDEFAVLTGGWYKKMNHTVYYPVGGDNGKLVQLVWQSGRSPGPPAFFFALGQFVHDCLPDNLIYFHTGEQTFRECVEDYYRMEDRIRKNRGEKVGRRRLDNSREGVRFMFAAGYSRVVMEILTGSSQSHFRHRPTEEWFFRNLDLPVLHRGDKSSLRRIRAKAREIIESYEP